MNDETAICDPQLDSVSDYCCNGINNVGMHATDMHSAMMESVLEVQPVCSGAHNQHTVNEVEARNSDREDAVSCRICG